MRENKFDDIVDDSLFGPDFDEPKGDSDDGLDNFGEYLDFGDDDFGEDADFDSAKDSDYDASFDEDSEFDSLDPSEEDPELAKILQELDLGDFEI